MLSVAGGGPPRRRPGLAYSRLHGLSWNNSEVAILKQALSDTMQALNRIKFDKEFCAELFRRYDELHVGK
jgi:hypothetical protein